MRIIPHSKKPWYPKRHDRSAFTLIEILIIITVIAIVSVSAFYGYTKTTSTFQFISKETGVLSLIRSARSYALTNKRAKRPVPGENGIDYVPFSPDNYTVKITAHDIKLFADDVEMTDKDPRLQGEYQFFVCNVIEDDCDLRDTDQLKSFPFTISYEKSTGTVEMQENGSPINESIAVLFQKNDTEDNALKKYILIFKVSGLAEEYNYPLLPWGS